MQDPNSPGIEPMPSAVEVWMAREFLVHFMYEVLKLREIKMMWSRLNEQIRGGGRIQSWIYFSPETCLFAYPPCPLLPLSLCHPMLTPVTSVSSWWRLPQPFETSVILNSHCD